MEWLTRSDTILLGVAAYIAVITLVRLMRRRRDRLIAEVQQQVKSRRQAAKRADDGSSRNRDAA